MNFQNLMNEWVPRRFLKKQCGSPPAVFDAVTP